MLFWRWWRKSNEELVRAYFLHVNITIRMTALSVLQDNASSLTNISFDLKSYLLFYSDCKGKFEIELPLFQCV